MYAWILRVVGIILTLTVLETVLPDKKTKNILKTCFSLCFIFVLIDPLLDYKDGSISVSVEYADSETDYSEKASELLSDYYEKALLAKLKGRGMDGVKVEIDGKIESGAYDIKNVKIFLENLRLNEESQHINITEEARSTATEFLGIDGSEITVYE